MSGHRTHARVTRLLCTALTGLSWLAASAAAAAAPVQAVEVNGPPGQVVDLVFVAEGYVADEAAKFQADAVAAYKGLFKSGPYAAVRPLLSAHALFVASQESGSDHPSAGIDVDTAFDSTFESHGIARLLVANSAAVMQKVNDAFPAWDVAIVLVNDTEYGGSGGAVPVTSLHAKSAAILRHELAHRVADLADTYTAPNPGYPPGDSEPNVASVDHLDPVKWAAWISPDTSVPTPIADAVGAHAPVGAYEGARYQAKDMFRPAPTCLMRSLAEAFCPICSEAIVRSVAADSGIGLVTSPDAESVTCALGDCPVFTASAALESVATWQLDGVKVGEGETWTPTSAVQSAALQVALRLSTPLVRNDPEQGLQRTHTWALTVTQPPAVDAGGAADVQAPADVQGDVPTPSPSPAPAASGCASQRRVPRPPGPALVLMLLCGLLLRGHRGPPAHAPVPCGGGPARAPDSPALSPAARRSRSSR